MQSFINSSANAMNAEAIALPRELQFFDSPSAPTIRLAVAFLSLIPELVANANDQRV